MRALGVAWGMALSLVATVASAAGPLDPNGQPITTSDYSIDLFQGPVFAGTRVSGLGGAYVAIAEDVDGDLQNPASPANRPFFSVSYFDWWLGLGLTFPGTLDNMDYFNSGSETELHNAPDSFLFLIPAMNLQWGEWGMGITSEISNYTIGVDDADGLGTVSTLFTVNHLQLARTFWKGQFVAGLGNRILITNLQGESALLGNTQTLFTSTGSGLELGFLLRPDGLPFRIGGAYRSKIRTRASFTEDLLPNADGDIVIVGPEGGDIYIPKHTSLPWDLNVGAAVQIGRRPMNIGWRVPHPTQRRADLKYQLRQIERDDELERRLVGTKTEEEREQIEKELEEEREQDAEARDRAEHDAYWEEQQKLADMSRFYLLLSGSMVMSGRAEDAVGVESFLSQVTRRSGESVVFSPRVGLESEVWPDMLKLRAGSYVEPPRLLDAKPRIHGTAGLDLRLIRWSVFGIGPDDYLWRLALSADVAERYFTWGIMVGGWYPRHQGKITHPASIWKRD